MGGKDLCSALLQDHNVLHSGEWYTAMISFTALPLPLFSVSHSADFITRLKWNMENFCMNFWPPCFFFYLCKWLLHILVVQRRNVLQYSWSSHWFQFGLQPICSQLWFILGLNEKCKGVMHFITNIQFLVCHLIKRITSIQQFSVTFSLTLFFFSVFFFFSRQVNNFLGFLLFSFSPSTHTW